VSRGTVPITIAGARYDRTQALIDGRVCPKGVELTYLPMTIEEVFWRALRHREFDATELSLAYYMRLRASGDRTYVAIPVFPSRFFRHGCVFVPAESPLTSLSQLAGRFVGLPEYTMTACVWIRGLLADECGIRPNEMRWCFGGIESPGRRDRIEMPSPAGIELVPIGAQETLNGLLAAGKLDALITPRIPSAYWEGRVRRLLPNYIDIEIDYFKRTHIFPVMHVIALRSEVHDRHPWIARSLFDAYQESKRIAYEWLADINALPVSLAWYVAEWERTRALMGGDPWVDGLEPNRTAVELLQRYLVDQGLASHTITADELFAPATLDEFVI